MKPVCEHCMDTGRMPGSDYLDCGHCDMAAERAELDRAVFAFIQANPSAAVAERWFFIHQRAKALERAKGYGGVITANIDITDAFGELSKAQKLLALADGQGEEALLERVRKAVFEAMHGPDADPMPIYSGSLIDEIARAAIEAFLPPAPAEGKSEVDHG